MRKTFTMAQTILSLVNGRFPIDRKQALAMPVEQLVQLSVRLHEELVQTRVQYEHLLKSRTSYKYSANSDEVESYKLRVKELAAENQKLYDEVEMLKGMI